MTFEVKRCPFCNHWPDTLEVTQCDYAVKCFHCGTIGPRGMTKDSAVEQWNGHHKFTNPSALVINRRSNHHEMKKVEL